MQSKAINVAAYLKEVPPDRQAVLKKLRSLCRKVLAGYEEGMDYGMPVYKKGGEVEVAFASQKNYIAIYFLKSEALRACQALLKGIDMGKGCLRFPKAEKIDVAVIEKLLRHTASDGGKPC